MKEKYYCKICGKETGVKTVPIKECLIGTHEEFEYSECEHCKSLELINIPQDIGKYYNEGYYSFNSFNAISSFIIKHLQNSYFHKDTIGNLLRKFLSDNEKLYELMSKMIKEGQIKYDSKILDIGCGRGLFLQVLREIGFNNLDGLEPFIENEIHDKGVKIYKSYIEDFNPEKTYDLIFFKDSLEHMENPFEDLKKVKEWLN